MKQTIRFTVSLIKTIILQIESHFKIIFEKISSKIGYLKIHFVKIKAWRGFHQMLKSF